MLIISCHADTCFCYHSLSFTQDGMINGHLDNFVGVHSVMKAYFSGRLNQDYTRIELTYGEETDFEGAYEVLCSIQKDDVVLVVDVTGTRTDKDFVIEKCQDVGLRSFLKNTLSGMSFDIYEDCPDPIANQDEVDVYREKCKSVFMLAIPCIGDYNKEKVLCKQQSIESVAEAICRIVENFPKFSKVNWIW